MVLDQDANMTTRVDLIFRYFKIAFQNAKTLGFALAVVCKSLDS